MRRWRPALAAALLVLPVVASAAGFEHPDFASNVRRPKRVLVLPPQTQIVRARMTDAKELVKETAELERGIATGAADTIDVLGYDGDADVLDPAAIQEDREIMGLVKDLQDRIDDALGHATRDPRDVRVGRFTLGEAVLPLADRTKADAFLAVRAQSIVPSKGRRALGAFLGAVFGGVPVPPTNVTQGIVVLVDARTGDLAWLNGASVSGAVVKEPGDVGAHLAKAMLRAYPRVDEVHKVRKGKKGSEPGESAPQPSDDTEEAEAAIARFEQVAAGGEAAAGAEAAEAGPGAARHEPTEAELAAIAARADAGTARASATPAPAEPTPVEDVTHRDEFAGGATPVEAPEAVADPVPPPAPALSPDEELRQIDALWRSAPGTRPAPTRQVVFQMLDGGPGIVLRNMSEPAVRISVDLGPWMRLDAAERREVPAGTGAHRILVVDDEGVEIARASCIVGEGRLAMAEVWPVM